MKGHLKEKTIIQTALAGHEAIVRHPHISSCPRCRSKAEEYLKLLSPSIENIPDPSPAVETRILKTYRDLSTEKFQKAATFNLPGYRTRIILAGSTAVAAVMLMVISMFLVPEKPTGPFLTITPREKTIIVNNTSITDSHIIKDIINSVNIKGASLITLKDFFSVSLYRHSELSISGLQKDAQRHPLITTLKEGTLSADVNKLNRKYIFLTPDAKIVITGTRFKLTTGEYTTLYLKEGSVHITAIFSGKSRSLCAGQSCRITSNGTISTLTKKPLPVKTQKFTKEEKTDNINNDMNESSKKKILHKKEVKRNRHEMGKIKRSFRPGRNR